MFVQSSLTAFGMKMGLGVLDTSQEGITKAGDKETSLSTFTEHFLCAQHPL